MITVRAGAFLGLTHLLERTCIACVCVEDLRGEGACSALGDTGEAPLGYVESSDLIVLAVAAGVLAVSVGALCFAKRDVRVRPARDDDTRRRQP